MGKTQLNRTWNETRTNDSWAIFKIMAEFVEGFEKLKKLVLVYLFLDQLELSQIILIMAWQKMLLKD